MAGRPKKTGADWFSHDSNARNNRKIKALENKFGLEGYAVFFKTLEMLSEAEGTRIEFNESEVVLVAGDFGVDPGKLGDIWAYCIILGLFQKNDLFLFSLGLNERLEPMFKKRKKDRTRQSANYRSENSKGSRNSPSEKGNSPSENDTKQSKANESIEEEKEEFINQEDQLGKIQGKLLQRITEHNSQRVEEWRQQLAEAGGDMELEELMLSFVNKAIAKEYSFESKPLRAGFDGYIRTTVRNQKKQNERTNNRKSSPARVSSAARKGKDTSAAKDEERFKSGW